ncbi:DNA phosphorothioation-dependent restriction protein DptF [Reinekea marina]|uniref:DNA phosphorothioation-dependent restriction protein DptF n=1 Tax=Reinekea marina TaxID=1310421 RepID=A0ABV7WSZ9_9GAMM
MNLEQALSILSKASPLAVTTSGEIENPELKKLKDYLYVKTDIEADFKATLDELDSGQIVFLCGSSGDGKSEILTRYEGNYKNRVDFHLDATHSFEPNQTAIEALNDRFRQQVTTRRPLVVGINIGMMANYEREGDDEFHEIKSAIRKFLKSPNKNNPPFGNGRFYFLNFEAYSKFEFEEARVSAPHMQALIGRVVADDQNNAFRSFFNKALGEVDKKNADNVTKKLVSNYLILREKGVQKTIIELLLNARIREDQFITTRMLLDFIHQLIAGGGHIWNNLFSESENELTCAISTFDPSVKRTKKVDTFILNLSLKLPNPEYEEFRDEVHKKYQIDNRGKVNPSSIIRQVFLFKNANISSTFTKNLCVDFQDESEFVYRQAWNLHNSDALEPEERKKLKIFYENVIFRSINLYANRNAPDLPSGEVYLSTNGSYKIAAETKFKPNFNEITEYQPSDIHSFNLLFTVNKKPVEEIPMNVNLLSVMMQINNGLKPNKFDKNSVVVIDELVSKISTQLSSADELHIYGTDNQRIKVSYSEEDQEIEVGGL